mmetsp:Transcript_14774/g.50367  ORF Transcript_14774/g.50367 Transcript_14774/m.50367 type:complete len:502 (+) Transcript_14774:269-1774(+)
MLKLVHVEEADELVEGESDESAGEGGGERDDAVRESDGGEREADEEAAGKLEVLNSILTDLAILRVRIVHVKEFALVELTRWHRGSAFFPWNATVGKDAEPVAEESDALVLGLKQASLISVSLSGSLHVAIARICKDLLLVVEQHHVLMEKQGGKHMVQPLGHREGKEAKARCQSPILSFHEDLASDVSDVSWFRRGRVQRQERLAPVGEPALDPDHAGRKKLLHGVAALSKGRRLVEGDGMREPSLSRRVPCRLHPEERGRCVSVAYDAMMRNSHVGRVEHVFHEEVPPIGHIPDAPGQLLCPSLQLRVLELCDQSWALQRALDGSIAPWPPLLPPHPQEPLRLHGRVRQGACSLARHEGLRLLLVCLRDESALAIGVKPPPVVGAEQRSVLLDPSLAQRSQTVGAGVLEHVPLVGRLVVPHDQVVTEELDVMRLLLVEELDDGKGVPLLLEVELLTRVPSIQLLCFLLVLHNPVLHTCLHADLRDSLRQGLPGKNARSR